MNSLDLFWTRGIFSRVENTFHSFEIVAREWAYLRQADLKRERKRHWATTRVALQIPIYGEIETESSLFRAPSRRQLTFLSCC